MSYALIAGLVCNAITSLHAQTDVTLTRITVTGEPTPHRHAGISVEF